jgi:hypothetical protein
MIGSWWSSNPWLRSWFLGNEILEFMLQQFGVSSKALLIVVLNCFSPTIWSLLLSSQQRSQGKAARGSLDLSNWLSFFTDTDSSTHNIFRWVQMQIQQQTNMHQKWVDFLFKWSFRFLIYNSQPWGAKFLNQLPAIFYNWDKHKACKYLLLLRTLIFKIHFWNQRSRCS